MTRRARGHEVAKAVLAALLAVAGVGGIVLLIARSSGSGTASDSANGASTSSTETTVKALTPKERQEQQDASAWDKTAQDAFGGTALTSKVLDLVKGANEWRDGTRSLDRYRTELDDHLAAFRKIGGQLHQLHPFPFDDRVVPLYQASGDLYVETVRAYQAEIQTPPGPLRDQVHALAQRVRVLADRVFDRGRALVTPYLHEPANPDVQIQLPEEVPNWVAEGMAAGPPLDDPPPAPPATPTVREKTRPEQARDKWLAALRQAGIPPGTEVAATVRGGDPRALRDMARKLVDSAEHLRKVADPKGDREEGARVRLALLVQADAARAAQVAALADAPAATRAVLAPMSLRLAVMGDVLWAGPGLPDRRTGLDPALLGEDSLSG